MLFIELRISITSHESNPLVNSRAEIYLILVKHAKHAINEQGKSKDYVNVAMPYIALRALTLINTKNHQQLQVGDNIFDSNEGKADILNKHFQTVFTLEDTSQLPPSPYLQIDQLIINTPGLEKQLRKLKLNKAASPDQISPWLLKTFAPQCAQILQVIFIQKVASYLRIGKKHFFLLCIRGMTNPCQITTGPAP